MIFRIINNALFAHLLALTLFANAWWGLPAPGFAQNGESLPHLIEHLEVNADQSPQLLKVGGVFSIERFGDILIVPLEGEPAYSIEIPGAIAQANLPPSLTVSSEKGLQRIDVAAVANPGNPAAGLVMLVVQVTPGSTLEFLADASNAAGITFAVGQAADLPENERGGNPPVAVAPEDPTAVALTTWEGRPTMVRIAVLNGSGVDGKAGQIGTLLSEVRRHTLEQKLGQRVELANISNASDFQREKTVVYYRPGYLRAALMIAQTIPGNKHVSPMHAGSLSRNGIDIEILLGKDLP